MLESMQMSNVKQTVKTLTNSANKTSHPVETQQTKNDFDFEDILDILNPLHHIPVVSKVYKEQANDEISDNSKVVGDVFYGVLTGGVLGVLGAIGNAVLRQETGKDVSGHLLAFTDDDDELTDIVSHRPKNSQQTVAPQKTQQEKLSQLTEQEQTPPPQIDQLAKQDDYWSVRMKQLFEDDYFV